jgi:hypothetical protein
MSTLITNINQIFQNINASPNNSFWDDLTSERKTKFEKDPLAFSVAHRRIYGEYGILNHAEALMENDYIEANQIREYYSKKYFWRGLKSSRPLSEFRTNLLKLIEVNENWELTEREVGLFVKLPAFYKEDKFYDTLIKNLKTDKQFYSGTVGSEKTEALEFIGQTFRWQGKRMVTYWFKNDQQCLYGYTTIHNHPFNALFEEKIQTLQTFKFSCGVDNISDMWYNSIKTFTFLKEQNA